MLFPTDQALMAGLFPWVLDQHRILAGAGADPRVDVGAVDGSALRTPQSKLSNNPAPGDGPEWSDLGVMHAHSVPPGTHTLDGLRGRDMLQR